MSTFIPMVSSSPPPMDDGWGDGDDFGDFASADTVASPGSYSTDTSLPATLDDKSANLDSKISSEQNGQIPFLSSEHKNSFSVKCGSNQIAVEPKETESNDWADFKSCLAKRTEDTSCENDTCQCSNTQGDEENGVLSNTESDHSCNGSLGISSSSVQDTATKREQCDTMSQGSLTDSGMYSNDISPAPKTGDSLNFVVQFNCDQKSDNSGSPQFANSDGKPSSPSHSLEGMCSSDTSQTNSYTKEETLTDKENNGQIECCKEQTLQHNHHEESPEPLEFKTASFSEEEGIDSKEEDADGNFHHFNEDKDVFQTSDSLSDGEDVNECDKRTDSSVNVAGNTDCRSNTESDSKSDSTEEFNTFQEQSTGTHVLTSESTQENSPQSDAPPAEWCTSPTEINQTANEVTSDKCDKESQSSDCEMSVKTLYLSDKKENVASVSDTSCDSAYKDVLSDSEVTELDNIKDRKSNNSIVDSNEAEEESFTCDKNEDFEFADFSSADVKPADDDTGWCSFATENTGQLEPDDNWAAFSEPTAPRFELKDDDAEDTERPDSSSERMQEDDFGDFESQSAEDDFGDFSSKTEQISTNMSSQKPMGATWLSCFPRFDKNGNEEAEFKDVHMLESVAEEKVTKYTITTEGNTECDIEVDMNLWNYLKDMENARGIKFSWSNSNAMNMLLKAVNIECQSLDSKKSSMPVYASGLGVVLKPSSLNETFNSRQRLDHAKNIIVDMDKPTRTASGNTPQELPAVDFDWKTSGLTNPLDAHSTVPLDLDFFVDNDKGSSGISKAQQNEQAILQSLEPLNRPQRRKKMVQPLEHILANMKFIPTVSSNTLKTPQEEKKLSSSASEIVDKLRDFSFMKARVLMFPISGDSGQEPHVQGSVESSDQEERTRETETEGVSVETGQKEQTSVDTSYDWLAEAECNEEGQVKEMF